MAKTLRTYAKCPTCEQMHWTTRWYTGTGTARMYCEPCLQIEANLRLREQKLEAKLEKQAKADALVDIFEYEAEPTTYNLNSLTGE
jgi:hypothetical protein